MTFFSYSERLLQLMKQLEQKENENVQLSAEMTSHQKKLGNLEQLLEEERQQRANLEKNQAILAQVNAQLKEVSTLILVVV